jgi:hypothetical protein
MSKNGIQDLPHSKKSDEKNPLSKHLVYSNPPKGNEFCQVFNPAYTGYQGKIETSYGVLHPKEFIIRFQSIVLGKFDIATAIANFLDSSPLYQAASQKSNNLLYQEHLKVQAHLLAEDKQIVHFAEVKSLLNAQLPKIKSAVERELEFYENLMSQCATLKAFFDDSISKNSLIVFSKKRIDVLTKKNIILSLRLNEMLVSFLLSVKQHGIHLDEKVVIVESDEIKLNDVSSFAETLPSVLLDFKEKGVKSTVDASETYVTLLAYIKLLNQNNESVILQSKELRQLHESYLAILNIFLEINVNPLSTEKTEVNPPVTRSLTSRGSVISTPRASIAISPLLSNCAPARENILAAFETWFKKVLPLCQEYMELYQCLNLAVNPEQTLDEELVSEGFTRSSINLYSAKNHVNKAFLFTSIAHTTESKGQKVARKILCPNIWLEPKVDIQKDVDVLQHAVPKEKVKTFAQCITAQEKVDYINRLSQYLSTRSGEIRTYISDERNKLYSTVTRKSDAFIVRAPGDPKSLIGLGRSKNTDFISPHHYARTLAQRISVQERSPVLPAIFDFSDKYFQLVYKIHEILFRIGNKPELNNSSDAAIEAVFADRYLSTLVFLFLELAGKTEAAASTLNEELKLLKSGVQVSDASLDTLRVYLTKFLYNIIEFDKGEKDNRGFEQTSNRPTSAMGGFMVNSERLKEIYRYLYQVFNHNRHIDLRHPDYKTQPFKKPEVLLKDLPVEDFILDLKISSQLMEEKVIEKKSQSPHEILSLPRCPVAVLPPLGLQVSPPTPPPFDEKTNVSLKALGTGLFNRRQSSENELFLTNIIQSIGFYNRYVLPVTKDIQLQEGEFPINEDSDSDSDVIDEVPGCSV